MNYQIFSINKSRTMKSLFVIFLIIILADRVAPESRENLALFPLTTHEKQSKGEIAMLTEEWQPIKGYEGVYEVSNLGRVRSLDRITKKIQIDHIDNNKLNNHIENLQLLTNRGNNSKKFQQMGKALPTGVSYHKKAQKYRSRIRDNNKEIHLGLYDNIQEASLAYQNKLKEILEAGNESI